MHKILIIDDEPEIVNILKLFLTKKSFDVVPCVGGEYALELLRSGIKPDLMIVDMKMPKVKGIDILKELKNLGKEWPVIVLSGSIDIEKRMDEIRQLEFQQVEYFVKPIDLNSLSEKIKEMLDRNLEKKSAK